MTASCSTPVTKTLRANTHRETATVIHGDSLMIGWTAEHMELTDGDGQTNRLRYRWNRVRGANPNGHLAKAEPGTASPRSARSAALCP